MDMADKKKTKHISADVSEIKITKNKKNKKITPRVKLQNRFAIYASANFVNSVLKKLKEIKLSLLLTSRIKHSHKNYIKDKLYELETIIDDQIDS